MGTENVVCPHCSSETMATVPSGMRLDGVDTEAYNTDENYGRSKCTCSVCGNSFYAYSQKIA